MVAAMFARSGVDLAFAVSFIVLMVAAATLDVRCRRIPNALVLATLLIGVLFATVSVGLRDGTLRVLEGAGMGLGVWIPFWALGMIGAGDVKFFAAASAWLGPRLALDAALMSALMGGVLGVSWLIWRAYSKTVALPQLDRDGTERQTEREGSTGGRDAGRRSATLPYGLAMAMGLAMTEWFAYVIH